MAWRSTLQASRRDRVTPSSERNNFAHCTERFTVTPSIFLSSGRYSSSTLEQASSDALVALSPSYLQRHSRQTPASSFRSNCCTRERARVGDACRRSASINAGRWLHAVKLHGSIGQRHALLHHDSPGRSRRREGVGAHSHQCNENLLHLAILLSFKLLCSALCQQESMSFGLGRSGRSRRFAGMYLILSVRRVCDLVFTASRC